MSRLIYSMMVSCDGFVARPNGDLDWVNVDEIARLKAEPGDDLEVGGPTLAATFMRLGLIDEYRPIIHPVVLGRGIPYFPPLETAIDLQLVETRTFASGVVYLRYQRADGGQKHTQ